MSESKLEFAVYSPPMDSLPYLSVVILPDGKVAAMAFASADDAELYNLKLAEALVPKARLADE